MTTLIHQRIKALITTSLLLFVSIAANSQQHIHNEKCAAGKDHLLELGINPEYKKFHEELNALIEARKKEAQRPGGTTSFGVVTIPVIVHVVYNTAAQNIPDSRIFSQMDVLNRDFRRLNGDTINTPVALRDLGGDVEIEFRLARIDPQGNPTNGITRTFTTRADFGSTDTDGSVRNDVKRTANGGKDPWPTNQYLNLWVCNFSSTGSGQLLGYAQFPGGNPATDGIVIWHTAMGLNGSFVGRTTVHEIGHWLNLIHIWGDGPGCGPNFPGSDLVDDTPPQSTETPSICPAPLSFRPDVCSPVAPGIMYQNYMDYTDDDCMNMFSKGQVVRMRTALDISRASLKTTGYLAGPPVPLKTYDAAIFRLLSPITGSNFCQTRIAPEMIIRNYGTQTIQNVRLGYIIDNGPAFDSVYQVPNSGGFLSVYQWETFKMGAFTIPAGAKKLTIYCAQPQGNADLNTANDTVVINLSINQPVTYFAKYSQNFEGSRFLPTQWSQKTTTTNGFKRASVGGFGKSSSSIIRPFFSDAAVDCARTDTLFVPLMDITNAVDSLYLNFSYAYARRNSTCSDDSLNIMISIDCGQTFKSLWWKGGTGMTTRGANTTGSFVPTTNEWKKDSVNLAAYLGMVDKVRIAFVTKSGRSNNLYLDDISVDGPNVIPRTQPVFSEVETDDLFLLYPNPVSDNTIKLTFGKPVLGNFDIVIYNLLGSIVLNQTISANGEKDFTINLQSMTLSEGMYLVNITVDGTKLVRRMVVAGP